MTLLTPVRRDPEDQPAVRRQRGGPPLGVLLAALAVVAVRLPSVGGWLGKDEAGYLAVAQQWHAGGTSLYGSYWVDRPPLLITIFRAAALLGGTVPLRLIGIVAAVVTVIAVGHTARALGGRHATTAAGLAAAAFLVSPLTGATEVNGELLAAPFIAMGMAGAVEALLAQAGRRAVAGAALAGASGVAAVLVKQNMLDVLVFAGVLGLLTARTVGVGRLATAVAGFLVGGALAAAAAALWTRAHGTSLRGVWFAMYEFRLAADRVMAAHPSSTAALREHSLLLAAVSSGMLVVAGLLLVNVVLGRRDHPSSSPTSRAARSVPLALVATVAYDAVSIGLGGNFWSHYLIQLAVPLGVAAGLVVASRPRLGRVALGVVMGSAAIALAVAGPSPTSANGNPLGAGIGSVAHRGDTILTLHGHADVTWSSGLSSPYPYLWYLPALTLDPRAGLLSSTLSGPHAPTWFVSASVAGLRGAGTSGLSAAIARDYHRVAVLRRAQVYLHDGVHRAAPRLNTAGPS